MRRYYLFASAHFLLAVGLWYFVAATAQGVADGTGVAPAWLLLLEQVRKVFTLPLIDLVMALNWFRWWTVTGSIVFVIVAAANSALVTGFVWLAIRWVRKDRTR